MRLMIVREYNFAHIFNVFLSPASMLNLCRILYPLLLLASLWMMAVSLIDYLFSYVQVRTRMIEMVSKGLATMEVRGFTNSFSWKSCIVCNRVSNPAGFNLYLFFPLLGTELMKNLLHLLLFFFFSCLSYGLF